MRRMTINEKIEQLNREAKELEMIERWKNDLAEVRKCEEEEARLKEELEAVKREFAIFREVIKRMDAKKK